MKTYFIKASELRDRFLAAKRSGKADSCLNALVRPSCLIIDEIGHCEFDKECTRMFFDLIDRRYNKEGNFNMIFTSNKNPALWREDFNEDTTLLCALDRIFDDAMVFKLRGESFRGKKLETISLQTGKVKAVESVTEMKDNLSVILGCWCTINLSRLLQAEENSSFAEYIFKRIGSLLRLKLGVFPDPNWLCAPGANIG